MQVSQINLSGFNELKEIMEKDAGEDLQIRECLRRVWIEGTNSRIMLRLNEFNSTLVIANIIVNNKKIGVGTSILKWLKSYAASNRYSAIVIESTTTKEINNFARKHNFEPVEFNGTFFRGEFYGNWILHL